MKNSVKILAALAAGVVLGVLLAPGKGSDTRKKILAMSKKLSNDVKDKFSKGMKKMNELKEGFKEKTEEFS